MKNEKGINQKSLKNWMKYIMIFFIGIFLWQASAAQGWVNYTENLAFTRRAIGVANGEGIYVYFENKGITGGFDVVSLNTLGEEQWRVPFRNTDNWVNNYIQCIEIVLLKCCYVMRIEV